jgi:hypothetical protein
MNQSLRKVEAISDHRMTRAKVGPRPEFAWLGLDQLVINGEYQRSLSERSVRAIRSIASKFDWGRLKALSVVAVEGGLYEVIDGQHTAIAAATHGGIPELPCLVTRDKSVQERAGDFVGINRDRVGMTPMQVFYGELAAGEEIATEVMRGVELAGGSIPRHPPTGQQYKVGQVIAISSLEKIAREGGPSRVKRVVSIGVAAKLAPMRGTAVRAISLLLWDSPLAGRLTDREIEMVFRIYKHKQIHELAKPKIARPKKNMSYAYAEAIIELAS